MLRIAFTSVFLTSAVFALAQQPPPDPAGPADSLDAMLDQIILAQATPAPAPQPPAVSTNGEQPAEEAEAEGDQELPAVSGVNLAGADVQIEAIGDSLIITGSEQELAMLQALVELLDKEGPRKEVQVVTLKKQGATRIAERVQSILQKMYQGTPQDRPENQVSVVAVTGNVVLVAAPTTRMEQVLRIIEAIDTSVDIPSAEMMKFNVKHRKATEAAEQLKRVLDTLNRQRGEEPGPEFQVIAIDADNSIIVTAPETERQKIQSILDSIDVEPAKGYGETMLVVFPLLKNKATDMAETVNDLLKTQEGGQAAKETIRRLRMLKQTPAGERVELPPLDLEKPIKIIPDEGTESLIIATVEENIEPMSEILKLLDNVPVGAEISLRMYTLQYADAKTLEERLNEMFDAGKDLPKAAPGDESTARVPEGPVGEAQVYNVNILADHRSNTLIVSGRPAQLALIETIVERLDIPSCAVKFPLRLITLQHSDATRIGGVIEQLWEQRIESIEAGEPGASAVEREKVFLAVDIRSNSLIISASEENYGEIKEIVEKLDGTADRLVENIRFINCTNTSAADMASKIEELWERKSNLRREGDVPEDLPVIVADQRSNTLVIASAPEDYDEIKRLVEKLESQPLAPIAQIRLINLKHNDASSISEMFKTLFEERMQQRLAEGQQENPSDRVALANDPATNTILVASSKENFDEMMRIVEAIDSEPDVAGIIQIFTLKNAEATNVAEKIKELFDQEIYSPSTAGISSEIVEARKKVALVADPRSNAVIASASKPNLSIIESLIKTMDTEDAPRPEQDTRIFSLGTADALRVVEMLTKLFEGMKSNVTEPELFQVPTIIADERSNSLIVTGSRDALKRAEDLITRIEAQKDNRTAIFEIYPIQHASAAKLAARMQEMFDKRSEGAEQSARTPSFVQADEASNSLIVTASRDDHAILKGLLELLDKPSGIAKQFEIFPLKKAKAEPLAERLDNLFKSKAQVQGGGDLRADVIAVEPDVRTNSLIVWAAPSEMENIGLIISKLDTAQPAQEMQLRVIQLRNALAEDFAEKFTETITGGQQGGGSAAGQDAEAVILTFKETQPDGSHMTRKLLRQDITVTPDPRTNAVLVMAPAESMEMLEQLIRQIDKLPPQVAEIRLFPLANADAEEIVDKLKELFGEPGEQTEGPEQRLVLSTEGGAAAPAAPGAAAGEAGSVTGIRFAADRRTNTVIAAGAEADLAMVEKFVRMMDAMPVEDRINQVYLAKYATAEDLTTALKDFVTEENERLSELDDQSSLLRKAERHITVVGDEASNSVLLGVSPRYHSSVMEMVRQIDRPPPQVMIQALIAEVTLTDTTEFGMEFALQDLLFTEHAVVGPNGVVKGSDFDFVAGTDVGAAGSGGGFSFSITGEDFSFLLHALQSEGMIEVLSRPTILVENNEEANITIGDEAPYVQSSQLTDSGQTNTAVGYKDVGIILEVTPHINPDGYVNMEVNPEISSINPSGVPISEGLTAPSFAKRSAETVITIKDGETVVIGGLINTRESRQESKVPVVGDIPGLGLLFRANNHVRERTELLIMLTVDVIRDEFDAYNMSVEQRDKSGLMSERILRSPLMEGLRILPDEEAFGPRDQMRNGEPGPAVPPNGSRQEEREKRELYGPTPDVYGPVRPQRVENPQPPVAPAETASYGPVLPKAKLASKP